MTENKNISQKSDPILLKLAAYCAYQERCQIEIIEKLATLNVFGLDAQLYVSQLISLGYLDEERFAKIYAGSKFRVKKWGRKKIIQSLKLKKISTYCIEQGLKEIDDELYMHTLHDLAFYKYQTIHSKQVVEKRNKTFRFLLSKGYENDLIWDVLKSFD